MESLSLFQSKIILSVALTIVCGLQSNLSNFCLQLASLFCISKQWAELTVFVHPRLYIYGYLQYISFSQQYVGVRLLIASFPVRDRFLRSEDRQLWLNPHFDKATWADSRCFWSYLPQILQFIRFIWFRRFEALIFTFLVPLFAI